MLYTTEDLCGLGIVPIKSFILLYIYFNFLTEFVMRTHHVEDERTHSICDVSLYPNPL